MKTASLLNSTGGYDLWPPYFLPEIIQLITRPPSARTTAGKSKANRGISMFIQVYRHMKNFIDFLRMSRSERFNYVNDHGLTKQQRDELYEINRIVCALLQTDFRFRKGMRFEGTIKMSVDVPRTTMVQ